MKKFGKWTWDKRARKALLPILGEKETDRVMEIIDGCPSTTFEVETGKNQAVAEALDKTYPDEGYSASYHVHAKGDQTVDLYSRPWDMVT